LIPKEKINTSTSNKYVRGFSASKGNVTGKAIIINSISEIGKVKKGDILVTPMTTPYFTPLLDKVKAIITDEGGITCHAAIISREFKIPCIVGTKVATKIIKSGDKIYINADKGICKILT